MRLVLKTSKINFLIFNFLPPKAKFGKKSSEFYYSISVNGFLVIYFIVKFCKVLSCIKIMLRNQHQSKILITPVIFHNILFTESYNIYIGNSKTQSNHILTEHTLGEVIRCIRLDNFIYC